MRAKRLLFVPVVAFVVLAFYASLATAAPGPGAGWWAPTTTTSTTKPLPAAVTVPKSAAMLPGAAIPGSSPSGCASTA